MNKRILFLASALLMTIVSIASPSGKYTLAVISSDGRLSRYNLSMQPRLLWENDSLFLTTTDGVLGMKYADFHSLSVESGGGISGDVNGDGSTDTQDVLCIYNYMQTGRGAYPLSALDLNGDELVDTQDVLRVYEVMQQAGVRQREASAVKASGKDKMVVITEWGDVLASDVSESPTLMRDNATDSLILKTHDRTIKFAPSGIKQIYFEDKAIVDDDPYIAPKATDYMNPNLITHDSLDYEVVELDTLLRRATLRFDGEVPEMYVGQIYVAANDTIGVGMYVLTSDRKSSREVVIRYRPAMLTEMLYNCVITLSSTPDKPYFTPDSVKLDDSGVKARRQRFKVELNDRVDLDGDNDEISEIKVAKALYNIFKNSDITFDPSVDLSFKTDIQIAIGEPVSDGSQFRQMRSKIDLFQIVLSGNVTFRERFGFNLSANLLAVFPLPYEQQLKPAPPSTPVVPVVNGVPVFFKVVPELWSYLDATLRGQLTYAQTMRQSLSASIGVRYEGKTDKLTPIFKITPELQVNKPEIATAAAEVSLTPSFFPRINFRFYYLIDFYVDLMMLPTIKGSAYKSYGNKPFYQHKGEIEFKLRGGVKLKTYFRDSNDVLMYDEKMNKGLNVTVSMGKAELWKNPKNMVDIDSLKVLYAGFKNNLNIKMQVKGGISDGVSTMDNAPRDYPVDKGTEISTASQCYSSFSEELAKDVQLDENDLNIGQTIDMGGLMAKMRLPREIRSRLPKFLRGKDEDQYNLVAQLPEPKKAPLYIKKREPSVSVETNIGGLAEGLFKAGEAKGTQCDENSVADVEMEWPTPIGYKNVIRTSIIDSLANPIMSIDREMPWEVKNFDATWTTSGGGHGTIQYREGGAHVHETVTSDGSTVTFDYNRSRGTTTVSAQGFTTTMPQRMLPGTSCMGSPDVIIKTSAKNFAFKGFVSAWDMMYWQAEHVKPNPYAGFASFGSAEYLGYPCKLIVAEGNTLMYWQNLNLRVIGESEFKVTSLTILDEIDNPVMIVNHQMTE